MTGRDLANRVSQYGVNVNDEQVIGWLDNWQKDIAAEAGKIVRYTFNSVLADVEIALPTDYASLLELRLNGKTYNRMSKVRIDEEGYITFPEDLTSIIMRYRRIPGDYESLEIELEPNRLLHPIAFYYLISLYYDKEGEGDEESNMAARWMNLYEIKKNEIISKIKNPEATEPTGTLDTMPRRANRHYRSLPTLSEDGDLDV
jgi:hypothetical protein